MTAYILRRILLMIPTIFGIMLVTFVVIQFAPGGPIDHVIAKLSGTHTSAGDSVTGSDQTDINSKTETQ
jgi:microcin C transport system permease protein